MRSASAFLNLLLAGAFLLLGARWFREGATGWAAFAGLAVAMNLVLAVVKFLSRSRSRDGDGKGGNP